MSQSKVFVNRTLNLKRIKYIGLDMDHTLIRYNTENFERLAFQIGVDGLIRGCAEGRFEILKHLDELVN